MHAVGPLRHLCAAALLGACGAAFLGGCNNNPAAQVVAADGVLCDVSRRLAGAALRVSCLLSPQDDPHRFQLSPRQSQELRQAQLVLINGYGLTPTLSGIAGAVAIAELAVPNSPRLIEQGNESHDHDAHGDRDPHVWHDPRQAAALVRAVSSRLQTLSPSSADAIRHRQDAMEQTLAALHHWNQRQFATLPNRPGARTLATSHRSLSSLSRAYGLKELAVVDGRSGSDTLRPQAMAAAVQQLRQQRPAALFSDQWPASKALSRISVLSGIPLAQTPLRSDGLSPEGADLLTTLTNNTCLIVDQLGGRCHSSGQQQLIQQWQAIR